jgi:uncharacterized protein
MSTDKPSRNEDEYFAKRDAELIAAQRAREQAAQGDVERRSHYMKCPKDGYDLTSTDYQGVTVDTCAHCGGLWLDHGELDQLMAREGQGVLRRIVDDVRSALGRKEKS